MEDSLKKRYFYKLSTNVIGAVVSAVTQAVIPRGLGPKAYGDFSFLTSFFTQFIGFFDMGTSIGFYTKLSQRPSESGLVSFYMYYNGLVATIVIGAVAIAQASSIYTKIWPDQGMLYIYMAALWGIFAWITQVLNTMADAYGLTVQSERARIYQRAIGMVIVILLYMYQFINLRNYFIYHYGMFLLLGLLFIYIIEKSSYRTKGKLSLAPGQIKAYSKEFYKYANPLLIYSLIGMLVNILDRWMLQKFGGSIQQGFFGLSYQIGAVCFLFTSAMTPLIIREFSIAYDKKDIKKMADIFRKHVPLLYSIASFFSCFVVAEAGKVVYIFGGSGYKSAAAAVVIMALYPIHQTYGQLSDSVFFATEQTRLYRNIGIILMLAGLPITYFFIAPKRYMGLDFGAMGLAIKMILIQFTAVNIRLYYNAKYLKFDFWKYFAHQIVNTLFLLAIAFGCAYAVDRFFMYNKGALIQFFLSGVLYTCMVAVSIHIFPDIFGVKREHLDNLKVSIANKFRKTG
jgi:O-antigen/teichoic acid export membrane protein